MDKLIQNCLWFSKSLRVSPAGFSKCPICLETMYFPFVLGCNHSFHEDCIEEWMYIKNNCPMCRKDIIEEDHVKYMMMIMILYGMDL